MTLRSMGNVSKVPVARIMMIFTCNQNKCLRYETIHQASAYSHRWYIRYNSQFFCFLSIVKISYLHVSFFIHIGTPATELGILEQQTLKEVLPTHGVHDLRFAAFFGYCVFISHFNKSSPSISLILNFSAYSLAPGENLEEDININTFLCSVFSSSHPALKSRISPGGMGVFQCLH